MASFSNGDVVLIRFPFSDGSDFKVRPAVMVSAPHPSRDIFIVPLTSRLSGLLDGEFALKDWKSAGLNVASAVKRGLFTVHQRLIFKTVGRMSSQDASELERSLRSWLNL